MIPAIATTVANVASNVKNFIGGLVKGKTPHITFEECSRLVHSIIDDWIAAVISQIPNETERRKLAAIAVQSLDKDFYRTYQLGVENLAGVRDTWMCDNWQEATGARVGVWDLNTLASVIGGRGVSATQIFSDSVWRVGMLAFTNISPGTDATSEARSAAVWNWYANLISQFSSLVGRKINPFPAVVIAQTGTTEPTTQPEATEEIFVAAADVIQSTIPKTEAQKETDKESGMIFLVVVAVALGLLAFGKGKK